MNHIFCPKMSQLTKVWGKEEARYIGVPGINQISGNILVYSTSAYPILSLKIETLKIVYIGRPTSCMHEKFSV